MFSVVAAPGWLSPGSNLDLLIGMHSVLNKRQEIETMLSLHDLDMLCVTETWLTPDYVFEFFGYSTFRCDRRLGRGGGVLALIRSELAVTGIFWNGDPCLLACPTALPFSSAVTLMPILAIGVRPV